MTDTLYIGSDHGGFELKEHIKKYLESKGLQVEDLGTYSTESCDYPEFGHKVGEKVVRDGARGIVCCGTGIGISIAANKVKGVRAALVYDVNTAKLAKEHNNANIIALGGRTTKPEVAEKIVDAWLDTEFAGGRHQRRIEKIEL